MFLPATTLEMKDLGWDEFDIILVTGDAYIDSPHIGVAVIGKSLVKAGYRVGVISQPDINSASDVMRLGEPALFWGVTGGSIDSLVANYTPLKKKRKSDDYTPGGRNTKRPDRAVIVYANLIRRFSSKRRPIVLGGIEASLRRIAHYDFWSDTIRRSILFDAKADILVYGMGEYAAVELAQRLSRGQDYKDMRGICYISRDKPSDALELPSFEDVLTGTDSFIAMFHAFYENNDPVTGKRLSQRHADRYLVHNPPWPVLTEDELDAVYGLDFEREVHPHDRAQGEVKALQTIAFSITTHRGCMGQCNFCSITMHEGAHVVSRSEGSILAEAERIASLPGFKGYLQDVGGPTANMYGLTCSKKGVSGVCRTRRCLYPEICPGLSVDHSRQTELLKRLRSIPGVKKAFVTSGIRHDLVCADKGHGRAYLKELAGHHVSGQLKLAPEHTEKGVLARMGKAGIDSLTEFRDLFLALSREKGLRQFLTYYFLAAHPGCSETDMKRLGAFIRKHLKLIPEQVQIFTPTPSTFSTLMYCTGRDPFTGERLFVERDPKKKALQKDILTAGRRGGCREVP
jgi:uncharacterized radical SAM protein YgiQ